MTMNTPSTFFWPRVPNAGTSSSWRSESVTDWRIAIMATRYPLASITRNRALASPGPSMACTESQKSAA